MSKFGDWLIRGRSATRVVVEVFGVVSAGTAIFAVVRSATVRSFIARQWEDGAPQLQIAMAVGFVAVVLAVLAGRGQLKDERAKYRELEASLDPDRMGADRALYARLLHTLASDGNAMRFVRHHQFDASYEDDNLRDVRRFVAEWDHAEHSFHNADVDASRGALHEACRRLCGHLAEHSFNRRDSHLYRIYPDHDLDMETADNKWLFDVVREANDLSIAVWDAHQEFVAMARSRLAL